MKIIICDVPFNDISLSFWMNLHWTHTLCRSLTTLPLKGNPILRADILCMFTFYIHVLQIENLKNIRPIKAVEIFKHIKHNELEEYKLFHKRILVSMKHYSRVKVSSFKKLATDAACTHW